MKYALSCDLTALYFPIYKIICQKCKAKIMTRCWRSRFNHASVSPDHIFEKCDLLYLARCRCTQSGLETQLILKRACRVNPRSQHGFVVTAVPSPKQQFTDHTGQTSTRTTQSQSTSDGLFDQNTIDKCSRKSSVCWNQDVFTAPTSKICPRAADGFH